VAQVENCLFKSYRQYFEASPIFRDMFSLPSPADGLSDGCSPEQPIQLEGIKKVEFAPFLNVMETKLVSCKFGDHISEFS
jgi:hypothetical protein